MSVLFPSLEFFMSLKTQIEADPASMEGVDPSEAYCGLAIGDSLYVMEFDGRGCAGVMHGGNPLDLDFVLAGSRETWCEAISAIGEHGVADADHTLEALVRNGAIEVQSEDEEGRARAALGFLQTFLEQARHLEVRFE